MGISASDVNEFIQGGMQGYAFGKKMSDDARETKRKGDMALLAQDMAAGPQDAGTRWEQSAIKTDQQKQLESQTADMAIPTSVGGRPPAPPGPYKQGPAGEQQTPEDQEILALEGMVQKSTGRPVMMKEDWDTFRGRLLKRAGAIGDPATVKQIDEYVDDLQTKGFKQNAGKAASAALMGDANGTIQALTKAWGYMEDGSVPQIMPTKDGNYLATFVSETDTDTEGKPKPSRRPIILTPESIGELAMAAEDPAEFAKWRTKNLQAAKVEARAVKADDRAEDANVRAEAGEKRTAEKHPAALRKVKAEATSAEAKAKYSPEKALADLEATRRSNSGSGDGPASWKGVDRRALSSSVSRHIKNRVETGNKEIYELYEKEGNVIGSYMNDLGNVMRSSNTEALAIIAEKLVQYPGAQIAQDPKTGKVFAVIEGRQVALDRL